MPSTAMAWSARSTEGYLLRVRERAGRWRAELVDPETGRRVRALRIVMVRVTFSVDTKKGKEPPTVEITVCTNVPPMPRREQRRVERRIVNAVVKLLWVLFDIRKDTKYLPGWLEREVLEVVPFAYKSMRDIEELRREWPRARLTAYYGAEGREVPVLSLGVVSERRLDRAILRADRLLREMGLRVMGRPRGEYFASEDVIKIGVEYGPPSRECPRFPYVSVRLHLRSPKGREREWRATIYVRGRIVVDVLRRLGIRLERGETGE
jgi:hypothetical protein